MAYADDLLEQAQHLARREPTRPKQASLRRAVSTSYYALFHLLTTAAAANWKIVDQRAALARAFDHGTMKAASARAIAAASRSANNPAAAHLKGIATAFNRLQQERHIADYDNAKQWSRIEVNLLIDSVVGAFQSWETIRHEAIAHDYLLSLLVKGR